MQVLLPARTRACLSDYLEPLGRLYKLALFTPRRYTTNGYTACHHANLWFPILISTICCLERTACSLKQAKPRSKQFTLQGTTVLLIYPEPDRWRRVLKSRQTHGLHLADLAVVVRNYDQRHRIYARIKVSGTNLLISVHFRVPRQRCCTLSCKPPRANGRSPVLCFADVFV